MLAAWKERDVSRSSVYTGGLFAETLGWFREMEERIRNHRHSDAWLAFSSRGRYAGGALRRPGNRILQYTCRSYLY